MHEILLFGGTALGSLFTGWAARLRWMRIRRAAVARLGRRVPRLPSLESTTGTFEPLADRTSQATVAIFGSNRCPGVKAYDARIARLHETYAPRGIRFLAVNATDSDVYPGERLEAMTQTALERDFRFPYVQDRNQLWARGLLAVCTPEAFVVDRRGRLVYRGRIDDAMLPRRVRRTFLQDALDAVLADERVPVPETAPLGCSIELSRPKPAPRRAWMARATLRPA